MNIRKAAVLGAGVMGSGIAAHLANAGISTLLVDIVPKELIPEERKMGLSLDAPKVRNRLAQRAIEQALKAKPSPFFGREVAQRIETGNLEDDLHRLKDVDWIIEVVVENLAVKRELLAKVEAHWRPGTIVSSNTSGISINGMIEGRTDAFKQHFMGTHFFNPPRYMKLLEIIPAKETDPELVARMSRFIEKRLGKGVVLAKDTPNFIANRIGTYGTMVTLEEMERAGLTVDQVDELTGRVMGRPNSATFRTLDMVGLDTFVHVANNVHDNTTGDEQAIFVVPQFLKEMVARNWLGNKTGQGFYQKSKDEKGSTVYLALNPKTLTYEPPKKLRSAALATAKTAKGLGERLCALVDGNDQAGRFVWNVMKRVLLYSAEKIPEIADDIVNVDRAMKWGFNWEAGPFETWDMLGVKTVVDRMKSEGETVPSWVEEMLASGHVSFYEKVNGKTVYGLRHGGTGELEEVTEKITVADLKAKNRLIHGNAGASLWDMGDDVALLQFHSPNNAIGDDIIRMIGYAAEEVPKRYKGLVIGNDAKHFCVGANLMMMLAAAQAEEFDEIEAAVKRLQNALMALKYMPAPVVAAPFNMTLGGGAEVCFAADAIQASAETYMGLVEVGVGLIPGGGGNKELLIRSLEVVPPEAGVDVQPLVNRAFETIAMAKTSTSALEAKQLGQLRASDGISMNRDYLLHDAKRKVLALYENGYAQPAPAKIRVVGEAGLAVMKVGIQAMRLGGYISAHDEKIADKLAYVLAGGRLPANTEVSEQYLLDLEREAFLSLIGEPKTQERMQYMLTRGKPLRN